MTYGVRLRTMQILSSLPHMAYFITHIDHAHFSTTSVIQYQMFVKLITDVQVFLFRRLDGENPRW